MTREGSRYAIPCVLLHPEPGLTGAESSGLGGEFAWPRGEAWPTDEDGVPFQGGLQLWRRDFPELPYPAGSDLLQLFWQPAWEWHSGADWFETGDSFRGRWGASESPWEIRREIHDRWRDGHSVRACRLRPERVWDEPGLGLGDYLRSYASGEEYARYAASQHEHTVREYERVLRGIGAGDFFRPGFTPFRASAPSFEEGEPAPGMKLLGHPYPIQSITREDIACAGCDKPMMLLFSSGAIHETREPGGFSDVDGMAYVYVCSSCPERPLRGLVRRS